MNNPIQKTGWSKINDMEFRVGENLISIVDRSIIYIEVIGEQTDEIADLIRENYQQVFSVIPGKINQLINLNRSGKSSPRSRRLFKELNENHEVGKVAVFGMHPVAKVLASFVMGLSDQQHIRFFDSEEKALEWLRKDENG